MRKLQKVLMQILKAKRSEVPPGYLPVYVGREGHRFLVEIGYLNHPLLAELLEMSAEQTGYIHKGGIRIACDAPVFEHLLGLLSNRNPSAHYLQLPDLLRRFSPS